MKKILVLIIFLGAFACSEENVKSEPLTFDDFQINLKPEMDYSAIVESFGQPTKDIGSGMHIYVYKLSDSTEIWIGYADKIYYARHVDKNQQVLNTII